LVNAIAKGITECEKVDVVICPPFVYLDCVGNILNNALIKLGAQHVNAHSEGAFTGEIAPSMLKDIGCQYVIIGHSERRTLFGETDADVAEKCQAVLANNMIPVVCVGETLGEREAGNTEIVITRQVKAIIDTLCGEELNKIVIAYEPVWAIGTGKTATEMQAQTVHAIIRALLGKSGQVVRILYGGSVKASNAQQLFAMPDIDGGLIGGASLQSDEFIAICKAANLK
jgi:triosephosphate isomerase